jgi:hypothetical protein
MARILTTTQAERMLQAMAYINDIATHETQIELFNAEGRKVRVIFYGNQVSVDLFGAFPKDNRHERYGSQAEFGSAYNIK